MMRIQTHLKSGLTPQDDDLLTRVLNVAQTALDTVQTAAATVWHAAQPTVQTVGQTVSDPKFWTWPL